ncbi:MAG: glycosyltransferase family 4 protein [Pseudomonadota bacterium]|nr:glycosyltransferase family 4 protein [Pseudomonadota bacterium]
MPRAEPAEQKDVGLRDKAANPTYSARHLTVVQVLPALESGGVERGTLEVGKYLVDHGHRSIVISAGGRLVAQLEREGSEHLAWDVGRKSPLTLLRYVGRLRRYLRTEKVDILHVRSRMPAWVCYLAWRGMGVNINPATRPHLVTTVHGPYSVNRYSAVMSRGERVIAISDMIVDYVRSNYPNVAPEHIRLIPRGVDPAQFPHGYRPSEDWLARWRTDYPELADRKVLTLPARITRWKGQEDFIQLMQQLVAAGHDVHGPGVHGLIVGEAHPRRREFLDELKQQCRALGLEDHITFTGHRSDLKDIMAVSDIVLSLSREPEAFGRVTLEALSLGKPVIAYDHGGVHEQLAAILPAGAIPLGDIDAAAKKAAAWLAQPPEVPTQNPFTLARMLASTLDVYRELADA